MYSFCRETTEGIFIISTHSFIGLCVPPWYKLHQGIVYLMSGSSFKRSHVYKHQISDFTRPLDTFFFFKSWNCMSFVVQVSVLQRVGCLGDHLFLLNHILRCPAGVSKWAVPFIQVWWILFWFWAVWEGDFVKHFS